MSDISTQRTGPARPTITVAVEASIDPSTLSAQADALAATLPQDGVEVIFVTLNHDPLISVLRGAGGAKVISCAGLPGRAASQQLALAASSAPILVFLGPLTLPTDGFLEPLVSALRDGAAVVGPRLDSDCGFTIAADGSLRPRALDAPDPVQALPLDCMAAGREIWETAPLSLPLREGFAEVQLGRWAAKQGPVVCCSEALVQRAGADPISTIVCTHNRAAEILELIPLLVAFGATQNGGELIIVDNASTDDTPDAAAELAATHAGVRVVHEPEPGLSAARNAGARAATHARIAYLDDDCRPGPGWHRGIAWGLTRPGVVSAGGPIAALWPEGRLPGWPEEGLERIFGVLDQGDTTRPLVPPSEIWGGNFSIDRSVLDAVGGFDPRLGYSPSQRIGGEESAVGRRIYESGLGKTLYTPWSTVGHRIAPNKMTDRYLIEHKVREGIMFNQIVLSSSTGDGSGIDLMADVTRGLGAVLAVTPITGDLSLPRAIDLIEAAPTTLTARTEAAWNLGLLAGSVLLLGEDSLEVDDTLTLRLHPDNLRGRLNGQDSLGPMTGASGARPT